MPVHDLLPRFAEHLADLSRSPRTIRAYQRTLVQLDRELPYGADVATENELRAWLRRPKNGTVDEPLSLASRAVYHSAIRAFYQWAVQAGIIDFDPSAELTRPRVPEGLPRVAFDDQVIRLLTQAREPYRLWAQLAAFAGLRRLEVWRLHREHVTERSIRVYRGKGNKPREIPTHPIIWDAVKDRPAGPLVTLPSEKRLGDDFITYCQKRLDMREMSMHRIRGWFATSGYRHTHDIQALRRLLGHASLNTTARYIGVADDQLQAIIAAVPTFGVGAAGAVSARPPDHPAR